MPQASKVKRIDTNTSILQTCVYLQAPKKKSKYKSKIFLIHLKSCPKKTTEKVALQSSNE